MPGPLATLFRYFSTAPHLAQIPHLRVGFGRRDLDDHTSPPRIFMAWPEADERYEPVQANNPVGTNTDRRLLWMRVALVEFHLWAAALTGEGKINNAAEEEDHVSALEDMQQVVCQALASEGVWTRYRATPRGLRWQRNSGQMSILGMQAVLTVEVRFPVEDRPDLLVTATSMTSTAVLDGA